MAVVNTLVRNLAVGATQIILPASGSLRQLAGWKYHTTENGITAVGGIYVSSLRVANAGGVVQEFDGEVKAADPKAVAAPVVHLVPVSPVAIPIAAGNWIELHNDATSPGAIAAYVLLWI
jgi:hypothetical protein